MRMTLVLPALEGGGLWAHSPSALFPLFASSPCPCWSGMACSESLQLSPCAAEGEALTPHSQISLCLLHLCSTSHRQIPSPWHGRLLEKKKKKREHRAPKTCHCAKCFQTSQDVTVSQFQFIRWRREDAVTSKRSFLPIETGAALLISAPGIPPRLIFTCTTQTYGDPALDSAICSGARFLALLLFFWEAVCRRGEEQALIFFGCLFISPLPSAPRARQGRAPNLFRVNQLL